ncbi:polysaccharide deacetylase family protein [Salinibius halmophilus]|uniref:polysaccharide deacetylase family protein n=1 Tax=Salinibius halmophilus TaxID=1853216 RepID=UPI000E6630FA|nr:polysaccharide deacetylase family protein [Salinibius halmophilus]
MKHLKKLSPLFIAVALSSTAAATMNISASELPPGGVSVEQAPQFIAIAFDDNESPAGQQWVLDLFASVTNPQGTGNLDNYDGQMPHTTFFNSCQYIKSSFWNAGNVKNTWRAAFEQGHEVANHTTDHLWGGAWMDVATWTSQIQDCNDQLAKPYNPDANPWSASDDDGIGVAGVGFRTPYLDYNPALYSALTNMGMRYDATIAEGWHWTEDGTNYNWPYTLDNGSPGAKLRAEWGLNEDIGEHPGLWQVPVYAMIVPNDEQALAYGISHSIREKIATAIPWFDVSVGKFESADYNLFYQAGLTGAEVLAIMKHTLDLRLAGNRAPFTFLAHSAYYDAGIDSWNPVATSFEERRAVLAEFIEYALTHDAVRLVSHNELLDWMESPQALDAEHCYRPAWQTNKAYTVGDQMIHAGALYEATYWSFNTPPTDDKWGPWFKVMDCQ